MNKWPRVISEDFLSSRWHHEMSEFYIISLTIFLNCFHKYKQIHGFNINSDNRTDIHQIILSKRCKTGFVRAQEPFSQENGPWTMFPTLSEASQLITCKNHECQHNDNCFNPFQKLFVFVALLVMQRIQYTDEPLIGHCHIYNTTYMFSNIGIDIHKHIEREHVALGFPHRATRIHQLESMFEFLASAACRLALRVSTCRTVLPTEHLSASRAFFTCSISSNL